MATRTLGTYLDKAGQRPSGFDYQRLGLALMVFAVHAYIFSNPVAADDALWATMPLGGVLMAVLPMFFALSGFLVAGSMERSATLSRFLALRFLRIYPALTVEVFLTAILIGPFVTALPLEAYFTDPGFFWYLFNVSGHVTITLPGTFLTNSHPELANPQLWTVPFELYCYIGLGILILLGAKRDRRIVLAGTIGCLLLEILRAGIVSNWVYPHYESAVSGYMLVVSFMAGVCLYLYRSAVPASPWLALAALFSTVAVFELVPQGRIIACFPAAYLAAALGVLNLRRTPVIARADYSYDIYLYHCTIQQTIVYIAGGTISWLLTFAVSLPLTVLFAALSWHFIERPALRLKSLPLVWPARWTRRLRALVQVDPQAAVDLAKADCVPVGVEVAKARRQMSHPITPVED